jgi:hypothetical protein
MFVMILAMIHATSAALDRLEDLLSQIRTIAGIKEKQRGVFYRKSQAFLHFHEDPEGLFADLKIAGSWARYPVNSSAERKLLASEAFKAGKSL